MAKKIIKTFAISIAIYVCQNVVGLNSAMCGIDHVLLPFGDTRDRWDALDPGSKDAVKLRLITRWGDDQIIGLNSLDRPDYGERMWVLKVFRAIARDDSWGDENWDGLLKSEQSIFRGSVFSVILDKPWAGRGIALPHVISVSTPVYYRK